MSRDIPIIFSGPMVRALLDGQKTMTRRLLYSERKARGNVIPASAAMMSVERNGRQVALWPPMASSPEHYFTLSGWQSVKPGDRLWVRENFAVTDSVDGVDIVYYAADNERRTVKLTPCIHMPRALSRLTLIVTATKIEPLQEISFDDALEEGWRSTAPASRRRDAIEWFTDLWISLHGAASWANNPEVVAISFRAVKANIDSVAEAA